MDRQEWHRKRAEGIGGSDVEAMMGLSRFKQRSRLWLEKVGIAAVRSSGETPATRRGSALEGRVLADLAEYSGMEMVEGLEFRRHLDWDAGLRMIANTDGGLLGAAGLQLAEAKTTIKGKWVEGQVRYGRLPRSWIMQIHHYLATCPEYGRRPALVGVLAGPSDRVEEWDASTTRFYGLQVEYLPELGHLIECAVSDFWGAVHYCVEPEHFEHPSEAIRLSEMVRIGPIDPPA